MNNEAKDLQKALKRAAKAKVSANNYAANMALHMQQGRELLAAIGNGEIADAEQAVTDWNAAKPRKPKSTTVPAPPFPETEEP